MEKYLSNTYVLFLLRSRLFVAFIAFFLSYESQLFFNREIYSLPFFAFIFFATLAVYNLYYFKTKEFQYTPDFTFVSVSFSIISLGYCYQELDPIVLVICITLSLLYVAPIFFNIKLPVWFRYVKLLSVIIVWTLATTLLHRDKEFYESRILQIVGITFRFLLVTWVCLIFFIKDESNQLIAGKLLLLTQTLTYILFIFPVLFAWQNHIGIGLCILFNCVLAFLVFRYIKNQKLSNDWHLFYVDGVLLVQGVSTSFMILIL